VRGGCGPITISVRSKHFRNTRAWLDAACANPDRLYHAIRDNAQGQAVGVAVYQNCVPAMGTVEIGGLVFSPRLQRRSAATEAMFLMMRRVFDELSYRRYEFSLVLDVRKRSP